MNFKLLFFLFLSNLIIAQNSFPTPYEKGNGNQTVTYEEMVEYYDDLDRNDHARRTGCGS